MDIEKFSIDHCKHLNGLSWQQYFAHLLPIESIDTHISLQNECLKHSKEHFFTDVAKHLKVNEHAFEVLEAIENSLNDQILISNTESDSLINYLSILKIDNFFLKDKSFATNAHKENAISKKGILEKYLSSKKYDKIISIGDSPKNVDLASLHKNGISYLYSHEGYPLRDCKATYKINNLRKILVEI